MLQRELREKSPLISLTVTDEAGLKSDTVEVVLDGRDIFDMPPPGYEFEVFLGYEPALLRMGKYRVDSWEIAGPPNIITLSAASAELTTAIKGQKMRSWHDTTVGAIVQKIAGEHGLGSAVDSEIGARAVEHIDQQTESDLNFLSRLARRNGAVFKLADGKVLFAKKGSKTLPSGKAKVARTVRPAEVSSWSMTESERGGHKSVVAHWHDHKAGKRKSETAGTGKPAHRIKTLYRTQAEARAAARATLADLRRGKREGSLEMPGTPDFFAEGFVRLTGFHPDVDGEYSAKSVIHRFSGGGFITSVSLEAGDVDPE